MTPILLIEALKEFISGVVADMVLPTTPTVHLGYLPSKTKENAGQSDMNFIIIRPLSGEDQEDRNKVTVKLLFGTESQDDDGFMDVFNVMETVRIALLKKRIIEHLFPLELPYKWKFFEEQPQPDWFGEAETIWALPTVQQEVDIH